METTAGAPLSPNATSLCLSRGAPNPWIWGVGPSCGWLMSLLEVPALLSKLEPGPGLAGLCWVWPPWLLERKRSWFPRPSHQAWASGRGSRAGGLTAPQALAEVLASPALGPGGAVRPVPPAPTLVPRSQEHVLGYQTDLGWALSHSIL